MTLRIPSLLPILMLMAFVPVQLPAQTNPPPRGAAPPAGAGRGTVPADPEDESDELPANPGQRGQRGRRGGGDGMADAPVARTTNLMLSDSQAQDPFIVAYVPDQTYYLFTSGRNPEGRSAVLAYKSKDLRIWEGPQIVFTVPDGTWANPRDGAWAPEVHAYKGKYYLFVTLHNRDSILAEPPAVWRVNHLRGTVIAQSDNPTGPFELLRTDGPHPPREFMTIDGTLYVDPAGKPWMVYGHDWTQVIDGTIEAVQLAGDLGGSEGDPIYLFKASDGPWLASQKKVTRDQRSYVSSGPEMFRSADGHLLMLWSTHTLEDGFIQTVARSKTGELAGPWEQLDPLVREDSGHGMLFRTFSNQLMMVLQRPFGLLARAKLCEIEDAGDHLRVVKQRADLDTRENAVGAGRGVGRGRGGAGRGLRGRGEIDFGRRGGNPNAD